MEGLSLCFFYDLVPLSCDLHCYFLHSVLFLTLPSHKFCWRLFAIIGRHWNGILLFYFIGFFFVLSSLLLWFWRPLFALTVTVNKRDFFAFLWLFGQPSLFRFQKSCFLSVSLLFPKLVFLLNHNLRQFCCLSVITLLFYFISFPFYLCYFDLASFLFSLLFQSVLAIHEFHASFLRPVIFSKVLLIRQPTVKFAVFQCHSIPRERSLVPAKTACHHNRSCLLRKHFCLCHLTAK